MNNKKNTGAVRGIRLIILGAGGGGGGKTENFAAVKVRRQFPLVILVKVVWYQGKRVGNIDGKVMESRLLEICSRGEKPSS
jgi:hypothetical protein